MKANIEMPYIGAVLSVNHYKFKYYTKQETKDWMELLGWVVKPYHIEEWSLPLRVTCSGRFKNLRATPDLSNLSKVILDALEEVSGVNDRNFRWSDGDVVIDKNKEPMLFIEIEECLGEDE